MNSFKPEVTDVQQEILDVFYNNYINTTVEINRAWELTESFDDCIKLLECSEERDISIDDSYDLIFKD